MWDDTTLPQITFSGRYTLRIGVAMGLLLQARNAGYRMAPDDELMWCWATLRQQRPFLTLVRPRG